MDEPARRLSGKARRVWRLHQLGAWAVGCLLAAALARAFDGPWDTFLRGLPPVGLVLAVTLVPGLRWRRWRWGVRDDGIDIRHGLFSVRRTLVPWGRVQHVDTRQGLLEQRLRLATVIVHTAASSHAIPLLDAADADALRDAIAARAGTPDA